MRIRDPKTTALIFASGKMVVTGAKSEDDSRLASRKYARIIQKLGFDAKFAEFKIQNIVGSCDVKFPIRLEGLAFSHGAFSSYEPEVRAAFHLPLFMATTLYSDDHPHNAMCLSYLLIVYRLHRWRATHTHPHSRIDCPITDSEAHPSPRRRQQTNIYSYSPD